MKKHFLLSAMAVLALGLTACNDESKSSTESSEKSVINGTTVERHTTTETSVDENGNVDRQVDTETTVDPEGMMNKETVEKTHTEQNQE